MLSEEAAPCHAPGALAVQLAPWSIHPMGRHSPPTPLEMSRWLRWEWDHILTQGMQVEAAQWGWFR